MLYCYLFATAQPLKPYLLEAAAKYRMVGDNTDHGQKGIGVLACRGTGQGQGIGASH